MNLPTLVIIAGKIAELRTIDKNEVAQVYDQKCGAIVLLERN